MKTLPIVVAALACLAGALLWQRPCGAERMAAEIRLGMTPKELRAKNVGTWISKGVSAPIHCGDDGSTLVVEFSEAPHKVVAVHAYRPGLRRWLRAKFPFLSDFIPVPYDRERMDGRPLRPHPEEIPG
jgi:hypothetical protein